MRFAIAWTGALALALVVTLTVIEAPALGWLLAIAYAVAVTAVACIVAALPVLLCWLIGEWL